MCQYAVREMTLMGLCCTLGLAEIKPRGNRMARKRKTKKTKTKRTTKKNKPKEWSTPEVKKWSAPEVAAIDEALERVGKPPSPIRFDASEIANLYLLAVLWPG